jgi:hypothetical protein
MSTMTAMPRTSETRTFDQLARETSAEALARFLRFARSRFVKTPTPALGYVIEVTRRELRTRSV